MIVQEMVGLEMLTSPRALKMCRDQAALLNGGSVYVNAICKH